MSTVGNTPARKRLKKPIERSILKQQGKLPDSSACGIFPELLIDFINMQNPDHQDELFHVLKKHLRKDPVKSRAIDITPLHILEMTRQKIRRPLIEELKDL